MKKTFEFTKEQRRVLGALIAHTIEGTSCLNGLFDELYDEFHGIWPEVVLIKRDKLSLVEVLTIEGTHDNLIKVRP